MNNNLTYKVSVIPGDGIGPEIIECALNSLNSVSERFKIDFKIIEVKAGDIALKEFGKALPDSTLNQIKSSDVCIKGPVGESAMEVIVKMRQLFDLYVNLRPSISLPNLNSLNENVDLIIVRENTEDLYRGLEFNAGESAVALRVISKKACRRTAEYAFKMAMKRKKKVTEIGRAHVWTPVTKRVIKSYKDFFSGYELDAREILSKQFKEVELSELYVDACAMNLIRNPEDFDIIVTTNMFGDILSDEAAQVVGGLGLAPSANIGKNFALFEPVHGAAPDIAGNGTANPIAMILSIKLMLEWLSDHKKDEKCLIAAKAVEKAVYDSLKNNMKTAEIGGNKKTKEIGNIITSSILDYKS